MPGADTSWTLLTPILAYFWGSINQFKRLFNIYKGIIPKTDNYEVKSYEDTKRL